MDFTKFVAVFEYSALFFPSIPTLALVDQFEGFLTEATVARFREAPPTATEEERLRRSEVAEHNLRVMRWSRDLLFVSSWHLSDSESAAMWRLYLKSDEGVVVRSTIGRMKQAVADTSEEIAIGCVQYVDYDADVIPWDNIYYLSLHKRQSFKHEQEVRAIVFDPMRKGAAGIVIPVDLGVLIEEIYVAPRSPAWMRDVVERIARRQGLDVSVSPSRLDKDPAY